MELGVVDQVHSLIFQAKKIDAKIFFYGMKIRGRLRIFEKLGRFVIVLL